MKTWKVSIIIFSCITLLSCAAFDPVNIGKIQYDKGNYDEAAKWWNEPATNGNMYAQFNLGLLWLHGLGSTPKNLNEAANWFLLSAQQGYVPAMPALAGVQLQLGHKEAAISWLNLAARWNNQISQYTLRKMGLPVPQADLYQQQQYALMQKKAEQEQAELMVIGAFFDAINTYYGNKSVRIQEQSSYRPKPPITSSKKYEPPVYQLQNSFMNADSDSKTSPPKVLTKPQRQNLVNEFLNQSCTSDISCGGNLICVKPVNSYTGYCAVPVNESGLEQIHPRRERSLGQERFPACTYDLDCPTGFRCNRELNACVKQ